jgi:hypothetical protein
VAAQQAYKGRKAFVLRRSINEHLRSLKNGSRPQSGIPHIQELQSIETKPNFIILVRFAKKVEPAVVRISEALMFILFNAWNNKTFLSLQPRELKLFPQYRGLNAVSPLASGFEGCFNSNQDPKKQEEFRMRC